MGGDKEKKRKEASAAEGVSSWSRPLGLTLLWGDGLGISVPSNSAIAIAIAELSILQLRASQLSPAPFDRAMGIAFTCWR